MSSNLIALSYLLSSVCFILSLRGLSSPKSASKGVMLGLFGMILAILTTLGAPSIVDEAYLLAILVASLFVGAVIANRTNMTALPQLIAAFHSLVGLAAVLIAIAAFYNPSAFGIETNGIIHTSSMIEMSLGLMIGAVTFSGSIVAFGKLQGFLPGKPLVFKGQHALNALIGLGIFCLVFFLIFKQNENLFLILAALSFLIGFLVILPIGGADMPVIVSMLNSYSGWAAAGIGFTLNNHLLIITGALVGSAGAILSYIMCKGMNRSLLNVLIGGFGGQKSDQAGTASNQEDQRPVKSGSPEDAAFVLENAKNVIIVPGYGMAVAQAQHALREMGDMLKEKGVNVRYAIHPVAGRMPGHMNVLLAESNVPYSEVFELEDINRDFSTADVAFIIGANDITNPAAKTDPASPIYGMPILDVEKAGTVMVVKRSMAPGYAGVQNEVFFNDNTLMLFGDAKKVCEQIVKSLDA